MTNVAIPAAAPFPRDPVVSARDIASGKGSNDENFPVASVFLKPQHRKVILAFYRFARLADDVADHPTLAEAQKLALLDGLEASLLGHSQSEPDAAALRSALHERDLSPRHALDLLTAFRQDVTKRRYASWHELMTYCRYSAAPVGRFVLDVHGESDATWPANDALCAALQVINHWQDCAKDYRALDRVYMPQDMLAAANATTAMLGENAAPPALTSALARMEGPLAGLMAEADRFPALICDHRLALEVAAIVGLAKRLCRILQASDPLKDPVHLSKPQALGLALRAMAGFGTRRLLGPKGTR